MFENYIGQVESYLIEAWPQIESWELWGKESEWFVGIVAGVIGGYITLALVSMRVPKLNISDSIVLTRGTWRIRVINKRRRWGMFHGDALDLRAELHFIISVTEEGDEVVTGIPLIRDYVFLLPHRRFFRKRGQNRYVFVVSSGYDLESKFADPRYIGIRFRITAKDSFSNYERRYEKRYYKQDAVRSEVIDP